MEPPLLSREVEGPGKGAIFENSPVVSIYVSEEAVFLRTADFEGCLKALPTRPPPWNISGLKTSPQATGCEIHPDITEGTFQGIYPGFDVWRLLESLNKHGF